VWFLARALKEADSADRAAVKDAMQQLAGKPFDGALGTGLRMVDNSVVVAGKAIEYRDGKEVLLYTGELPR
jgi:branched-chain amino acid transport system substrate-binding protein